MDSRPVLKNHRGELLVLTEEAHRAALVVVALSKVAATTTPPAKKQDDITCLFKITPLLRDVIRKKFVIQDKCHGKNAKHFFTIQKSSMRNLVNFEL